ncbi:hypothetical protein B0H12DRAFT_1035224 [Mycena haematopus]|nr:hypothetical protein B0H12DRAFT_1035224 [Mycena haematopus]
MDVSPTESILSSLVLTDGIKNLIPLNTQGDWVTTPALQAVKLSVNTDLHLLICCDCAYNATNYRDHTTRIHGFQVDEKLTAAVAQFQIRAEYPPLGTSRIARAYISGLSCITDQFGCPECPYAAGKKPVAAHIKSVHAGSRFSMDKGITTQVLNAGAKKTCIRVKQPTNEPPPDPNDLLTQIKSFKVVRDLQIPNARLISPWLMGNLWHKEIEPHKAHIQALCDLVSFPKDNEFPDLPACVQQYFYEATALIENTELLVLRKLNTHDIDFDPVNHTPLHEHHQGNKTLDRYLLPVKHLLASLLRSSSQYQLPTSCELSQALAEFQCMTPGSLHNILMALWKTFWRSTTAAKSADPTMKFLCLFRLKPDGSFYGAKDSTYSITHLCRAIQLAMLTEIHYLIDTGEATNQMEAWEMHLATALSMKTMSMPQIHWLDRKKWRKLQYLGNVISLEDLQTMVANLENKITEQWETKVLLGLGLRVEYKELSDNLLDTTPGYSFFKDPRNELARQRYMLIDHIWADPALCQQFVVCAPGSSIAQINVTEARKWLSDLATLEGYVMAAAEQSDGGVTRGTELVSMLAENTEFRHRNLAGLGKFVAIIRQYDKTTNNTQSDKVIPLAMSTFLADMVIQIHTLARPFAQYLASLVWPTNTQLHQDYSSMLFMDMGCHFTSPRLSFIMGENSLNVIDWKMTIQPHRHINIAFRRKLCTSALELEDGNAVANAKSNGHSPRTENLVYGLSPDALLGASEDVFLVYLQTSTNWQRTLRVVPGGLGLSYKEAHHRNFDKLVPDKEDAEETTSMSSELKTMLKCQQKLLGQMFEISERLEAKVELLEQDILNLTDVVKGKLFLYAPDRYKATAEDEFSVDSRPGSPDPSSVDQPMPVVDAVQPPLPPLEKALVQRGVVPRVVTPSVVEDQPMVSEERRIAPHKVKGPGKDLFFKHHTVLNKCSAEALVPPVAAPHLVHPIARSFVAAVHTPPARPVVPRKPKGQEKDVLDALRQLYGPTATWKSHQQYQTVQALLALESDVFSTAPTGGGKTLTVILCSKVQDGISVIVLPLIALMEDWQRRLDAMDIPYEQFTAETEQLRGNTNLILVTCDMATTPRWRHAIAELNERRPVLRHVLDEGHYYACDNDFRPALRNAFKIRQLPTQMAVLTATGPEAIRRYLADQLEMKDPIHIAGSIHRPELMMEIDTTATDLKDQINKAKNLIHYETGSATFWSSDTNRYLIFVNSLAEGRDVAKELDLPLYHGNSTANPISDKARQALYDDWLSGKKCGMVCTSALGAGNDYAHVRFTIHLGAPFDMVLFNQQKGRAARDKKPGTNYVIGLSTPWYCDNSKVHPLYGDMIGRQAVQDLIYRRFNEQPQKCYNYQETMFFDGHGQTCRDLGCRSVCAGCDEGGYSFFFKTLPWLKNMSRRPWSVRQCGGNSRAQSHHVHDSAYDQSRNIEAEA